MVLTTEMRVLVQAINQLYQAAIRPPYIDPDLLINPPLEEDGWHTVNVEELRQRGKSDAVVELLRYLPYLRPPSPSSSRQWMVSPKTLAIDYSSGEVYNPAMDERQPTPAHCIWLTAPAGRDGTGLLLDVEMNTITEWSAIEIGLTISYEDYEKLSREDKWWAYPTAPAVEFLDLWRRRWEKLAWIPVPASRGPFSALWWHRALPGSVDEAEILDSDDDYEQTSMDDEDDESDEEASENESTELSEGEIDDLLRDSRDVEDQGNEDAFFSSGPPTFMHEKVRAGGTSGVHGNKAQEIFDAYIRNGWPHQFDRENCRAELRSFAN